jgi:hypothetical protein
MKTNNLPELPDVWIRESVFGYIATPEAADGHTKYIPATRLQELERRLAIAAEALDYVERRTDPEQKNPTEHHYIRSTRLRGVVVDALAEIRKDKP